MIYYKATMRCPIHKDVKLKSAIFYNTEVDYCPKCLGIWFEKGELRIAKDAKDKNLDWLDVELWNDKTKFNISKENKTCPACGVPMYEVVYGDSDIKVDLCNLCMGIWLDRGEFKKIIDYMQEKLSKEIYHHYGKKFFEEATEIFTGPESLEEETSDVLTVIGLLKYKLSAKYPTLADIISKLPKG